MSMLNVRDSYEELMHHMASNFSCLAQKNIHEHGSFHVALSGGRTPRFFYSLLSREPYISRVNWESVYIYQTDERFVSRDNPDNNYKMIFDELICNVPINIDNVFRMETDDISPSESSVSYSSYLLKSLPVRNGFPQLDFILLGIGEDGHVASLFPSLAHYGLSDEKLVIDVFVEELQKWRISLTMPVINRAKNIFVVAVGNGKSKVIKHALDVSSPHVYPIQSLNPIGHLEWYIDDEAASLISDTNFQ